MSVTETMEAGAARGGEPRGWAPTGVATCSGRATATPAPRR